MAAGALLAAVGCGEGATTSPALSDLELTPVAGDGAFALPGDELELSAAARGASDGAPRRGVEVVWRVESGDAALRSGTTGVSDSAGTVSARVGVGGTPGSVVVRVEARERPEVAATFQALVADRPRLDSVVPGAAAAGAAVTLQGRGFLPEAAPNVVLFSGVRGRVLEAAPERLRVEVPPCLPSRDVEVSVRFGPLASERLAFRVDGEGAALDRLEPGAWIDDAEPAAPGCLRLEGEDGALYLVVAGATGTVGGARFDVTLSGAAGPANAAALASPSGGGEGVRPDPAGPGPGAPADGAFAERWEDALRSLEDRLTRAAAAAGDPGAAATRRPGARASTVPAPGERRTFQVLNSANGFDQVTAVARVVGERAALFVDERAPAGGFTDEDLADLSRRFDEVIHPVVSGEFGRASDLDGNERIVVLFTPTVNELTPRGSDSFVAGFFFGLDLLPSQQGSNGGEVFYAVVPDPGGAFSDARPARRILEVVPAVLAHEFQHMVHFNERVLARRAPGTEALWLAEGLAQMAEESVARFHELRGEEADAEVFRSGNRARARRFLAAPPDVSLIVGTGRGSVTERGAAWLHVLYLADRFGASVPGDLTRTTRTGVENVTARAGTPWPDLLADWWSALFLDGLTTPAGAPFPFVYPDVDLRGLLAVPAESFPLQPSVRGTLDFLLTRRLQSSSPDYLLVRPPRGGSAVLRLGGAAEGDAPPAAGLFLRVVRIR